jgi:hypothetical protein
MDSQMNDSQIMVQVLNGFTNNHELQIILMEMRIGNKENPLTIDELQKVLCLRNDWL